MTSKPQGEALTDDQLMQIDPVTKKAAREEAKRTVVDTLGDPRPVDGAVLPEGFENPAPGEYGHYCVDQQGVYHKDWVTIKIHRYNEHDQDPFPVVCAGEFYSVYREQWIDVPPEVLIAIEDAVEVRHDTTFDPVRIFGGDGEQAAAVKNTNHKVRRFGFEKIPSA